MKLRPEASEVVPAMAAAGYVLWDGWTIGMAAPVRVALGVLSLGVTILLLVIIRGWQKRREGDRVNAALRIWALTRQRKGEWR